MLWGVVPYGIIDDTLSTCVLYLMLWLVVPYVMVNSYFSSNLFIQQLS